MNQVAIDLSNAGVTALHRGDSNTAFQSLSQAAHIVTTASRSHVHKNGGSDVFVFHWEDCSPGIVAKEGSTPFLSLRALRISTQHDADEVSQLCPCGFAWSIWFNLALCCSVIGTRLGEKGKPFLEMAYDLYEKVQRRVDSEPSRNNRHWAMMTMVVSNNQACIFHDFCMHGNAVLCLHRLASTLASCQDMEVEDRGNFCLNLQILGSQTLAAAA
eukprot:CAMPEP_0117044214 /NCGR_PEP_ID=MMETSP0472-20121206/30668_1 /TAXON_ID=693140 ORGANISM="Tiarina fusus, Strain LIS" /NCGR_SAMPLE_ID=MMETSP0472 /ASSEMBLY_ACC=CAM_ASM_000603 /LENGTH=214 /DNA_ID=CAMNT_0004755907 /DNA_START=79 /DNA_END=723 /DNA_ORIENTATION=-